VRKKEQDAIEAAGAVVAGAGAGLLAVEVAGLSAVGAVGTGAGIGAAAGPVGAGVGALAGLAGFGLYKLGCSIFSDDDECCEDEEDDQAVKWAPDTRYFTYADRFGQPARPKTSARRN
jgi:hypothetical protein